MVIHVLTRAAAEAGAPAIFVSKMASLVNERPEHEIIERAKQFVQMAKQLEPLIPVDDGRNGSGADGSA